MTADPSRPARTAPARRLLCLAGFMGSGKTTVGRILARQLGWHFVDLDSRIVEHAGMSIRAIFDTRGEPAFREIEREVLDRTLEQAAVRPTVVALGGGTTAQPGVLERLRAGGALLVWLDCPLEEILARCAGITDRPLFRDEASVRELYERRRPWYQQSDTRVESVGTPEEVASRILAMELLERVAR